MRVSRSKVVTNVSWDICWRDGSVWVKFCWITAVAMQLLTMCGLLACSLGPCIDSWQGNSLLVSYSVVKAYDAATVSMVSLNRTAAQLMHKYGTVCSCTSSFCMQRFDGIYNQHLVLTNNINIYNYAKQKSIVHVAKFWTIMVDSQSSLRQ